MKQIIFLLLFISTSSFAAKTEKGFLISTEFNFKDKKTTVHTKNEQVLAKDMSGRINKNRQLIASEWDFRSSIFL